VGCSHGIRFPERDGPAGSITCRVGWGKGFLGRLRVRPAVREVGLVEPSAARRPGRRGGGGQFGRGEVDVEVSLESQAGLAKPTGLS